MEIDLPPLEREWRAAYGAYEYLRAHDLSLLSATARLLREGDLALLARRASEEMGELRGAVAGTHGHGQGRDDIVLEAYQSLYWLTLLAVAAGDRYDDVRPHVVAAANGVSVLPDAPPLVCDGIDETQLRQRALRAGFAFVQAHCSRAGVGIAEAVQRDVRELRTKPYLLAYWKAHDEPSATSTEISADGCGGGGK